MKRVFLLGALLMRMVPGTACDQCGCGLLQGIQPHDRANNFGLQWRMRYLHGDMTVPAVTTALAKHAGHGTATTTSTRNSDYTEVYQALELRGQVWLARRFSVLAAIPLVNNYQSVDNVRHADVYEIGDPMILGRYAVLSSRCGPDSAGIRYRLSVGAGAKIPLGRHDVVQYGETLDHDLQPGTGTWDGLLSLEFMLRGARWGGSLATVGRYNGVNDEGHRMGHALSGTAEVFRSFTFGKITWYPSAGGYVETALPDRHEGEEMAGTGGSTVFTHVGTRVWWRSFGISFTWQHALLQDQGELMIPNRERFIAGITYNINNN